MTACFSRSPRQQQHPRFGLGVFKFDPAGAEGFVSQELEIASATSTPPRSMATINVSPSGSRTGPEELFVTMSP
ncbi:hypothetical protein [Microbacterium sp. NPDC080220]|uniref:hypothetical protein n=1 Tax=Microbacterium sp. NPDC080220 TaxID=3161017 RepID=UPI0034155869